MTKIDTGIPFPDEAPRKTKYPWTTMNVGDSFAYDGPMNAAKTNARYASEKHKKIFTAGMHKGAVRVWRTK